MSDMNSNGGHDSFEHKERLVRDLHAINQSHLADGQIIEEKAWKILRFTSSVFVTVTTITTVIITVGGASINVLHFTPVLGISLAIFIVQMLLLSRVIRNDTYELTPPIPNDRNYTFELFLDEYFTVSGEIYLENIISDYVGNTKEEGVIYKNYKRNVRKARYVSSMTACLLAIIVILVTLLISSLL